MEEVSTEAIVKYRNITSSLDKYDHISCCNICLLKSTLYAVTCNC